MGNCIKKMIFTFSVIVFSILSVNYVYAADAKITIGTASVVVGEEVKVKVEISSDVAMVAGDIWLSYDTSVITYKSGADTEGNSGLVRFIVEGDETTKTIVRELVFVGKKAGSAEIAATANCEIVDFEELGLMNVTSVKGKVTVTTPEVASGDNSLKKLVIYGVDSNKKTHKLSFKPSFAADKTEYSLEVGSNIEKLSVTATPNDSKATVKVSGLKLAEGDNVTTIKVTAENGDSKIYYIYTEKEEADDKEEETTKKPDNNDKPEEPKPEGEYIEVMVGEKTMYIPIKLGNVTLPEGFELVDYVYKEKNVQAAKGLSKNILIFHVLDENKENGSFYIYDEAGDKFYPMVNIQTGEKMYTIVSVPADFTVPEGFVANTFKIAGKETSGWTYGEVSDFVYVYAMNWDGACAIYCYDTVEKTMQRVSEYMANSNLSTQLEALKEENSKNLEEIDKLKKENAELNEFRKTIIIINIVIILILLGMIIWSILTVISKKKGKGPDDDDPDDTHENDDEKRKSEEAITKEEAINTLFAAENVQEQTDITTPEVNQEIAITAEAEEMSDVVAESVENAENVAVAENMAAAESQIHENEVQDDYEAEQAMISRMADAEIEMLTADLGKAVETVENAVSNETVAVEKNATVEETAVVQTVTSTATDIADTKNISNEGKTKATEEIIDKLLDLDVE